MKFIDEFRDQALVQDLARRLAALAALTENPATVMEVCGTHTMAAARFGLKSLLPPGVALISGPGCPVCVTDQSDLDAFLALGTEPDVVLVSFGDMLRVPGTHTSLEGLRAQGAEVRVVYSPLDAVELARADPGETPGVFRGGLRNHHARHRPGHPDRGPHTGWTTFRSAASTRPCPRRSRRS